MGEKFRREEHCRRYELVYQLAATSVSNISTRSLQVLASFSLAEVQMRL